MNQKINWQGIYPAVTTSFNENDTLDFKTMTLNYAALQEAGVDGIVLGGSLGEASTLSTREKNELLKFAVERFGSEIQVLMNVGESTTKDAIQAAQKAESLGADGLMLLPPKGYTADSDETVSFLKHAANATSLPIMIYNNPVDYNIEVTREMFEKLLEHDNIQAVKESTRDISNVTRLRNAFGDRLKILTGVDTLGLESLLMGADGWVAGLGCAFPQETVTIYKLVKAGRIEEAKKIYSWFLPLLELDLSKKLVQNIKLATSLTGIGNENVRQPRQKLSGIERESVLAIIESSLENRPLLPNYSNL